MSRRTASPSGGLAEMGGNTPVHADGDGCPKDCVGMRARAIVAFEHIAQRPLDHDAGELTARQLAQFGVEPFPGADDGLHKIREGLALDRNPRFQTAHCGDPPLGISRG